MSTLKFPIIVIDGYDLAILESASDAETYIEPLDLDSSDFLIFDSAGQRLQPKVNSKLYKVDFSSTNAFDIDALRNSLLEIINYMATKKRNKSADFPDTLPDSKTSITELIVFCKSYNIASQFSRT